MYIYFLLCLINSQGQSTRSSASVIILNVAICSLQAYSTTKVGLVMYNVMLLGSSVIPIVVLFALTVSMFAGSIKEYRANAEIHDALLFSMQASDAVHDLQQERDMTAFYIGTYSAITKSDLVEQYRKTDATLHKLSKWPVAAREERMHFLTKGDFLMYLNQHRYQLSVSNTDEKKELATYSTMISQMMNWLTDAVNRDTTKGAWKELVALLQVIEAKDAFGVERAYGAIFFSSGGFATNEDYHTIALNQAIANSSLNSAIEYSNVVRKMHERYVEKVGALTGTLRDMRLEIRDYDATSKHRRQPSRDKALAWFGNMTIYVNALFDIQLNMKEIISESMYDMYNSYLLAIVGFGVFLFAALPMCTLFVKSIYAVSRQIPTFHLLLKDCVLLLKREADRLQRTVESHEPFIIADYLKRTSKMAAALPPITIVAVEVVGLANITGTIVGKQVADAMDEIDRQVTRLAQRHDIFRLDRGCGSFIVIAGTSAMQRECHASTACRFALDLITECGQLPVVADLNIKFRIALHSAGAVGFTLDNQEHDVITYDFLFEEISTVKWILCLIRPGSIILTEDTRDMIVLDKTFDIPLIPTTIRAQEPYGETFWLREYNASMQPSPIGSTTSFHSNAAEDVQSKSYPGDSCLHDSDPVVTICINSPSDVGDSFATGSETGSETGSDTFPGGTNGVGPAVRGPSDGEQLGEAADEGTGMATDVDPTTGRETDQNETARKDRRSARNSIQRHSGDGAARKVDMQDPGPEMDRSPSRHGTRGKSAGESQSGHGPPSRSRSECGSRHSEADQNQCGIRSSSATPSRCATPGGGGSRRRRPPSEASSKDGSRPPSIPRSACGNRRQSQDPSEYESRPPIAGTNGCGIRPPSFFSPTGCVSRPPSEASE
ncbi:hypothetical protein LSAT2_006878 [Lamellibrachia satsuma]|nr:hypothetical protein LSAT2_006878 [Lamellibrachia satsuma]